MDDDELLDLVDSNDHVVGSVMRSVTSNPHEGYLRASELFIQNDKGQLWIPRRHPAKRIAPSGLDYSMGGHVGHGETYMEALIRETKEELNLELKPDRLSLIKKFGPTGELRYFRSVYLYKSNQAPNYNPDDFTEFYWLTPQELMHKLEAGEPAKLSLLETAQYLVDGL
ncbi:MAG: NUDIX domain-containing protein [Candidatus Saccharimonadales bacterium]